ncbi:MAG: hypothetical protein HQL71_15775 [Magnetococcales bacterium]|nr:hypothetical protein [Magnetococcales bacterium]
MLGFFILVIVVLSWFFYQIGSATAVLKRARFLLKKDIARLENKKNDIKDMIQDIENRHEQKLAEYDVVLKQERERRREAMEVKWSAYKEARVDIVEKEVAKIKSQMLTQAEIEVLELKSQKQDQLQVENIEKKQAAIDSLNKWMEQEKSRLQHRLDAQYEEKIEDLKGSLEKKVLIEIEQVTKETSVENSHLKGEIAGLIKSVTHDVVKGIE